MNGKHPTAKRGLLPRQERFCEFIASGMSGTEAWLAAGYKVERNVAKANASESLTKPDIAARIAALRKPQTEKALLTKDRKRELLMDFAENPTVKTQDRLRAIELDAKLAGHFAPDEVTVETGPETLDAVKERMERVASVLNLRARMRSAEPPNHGNGQSNGNGNGHANGLSRWNPAICARFNDAQEV